MGSVEPVNPVHNVQFGLAMYTLFPYLSTVMVKFQSVRCQIIMYKKLSISSSTIYIGSVMMNTI